MACSFATTGHHRKKFKTDTVLAFVGSVYNRTCVVTASLVATSRLTTRLLAAYALSATTPVCAPSHRHRCALS